MSGTPIERTTNARVSAPPADPALRIPARGQSPLPEGLTEDEAAARLAAEGPNELEAEARASTLALVGDVLREPMLFLLTAAASLYWVLGDRTEAGALFGAVIIVVAIQVTQRHKAERSLEALRDLSSPRASVIRSGRRLRIPGREVVRGDTILLSEGDRVPADGRIVEAAHLEVEESMLTGESVPVAKRAAVANDPTHGAPGGAASPFVYAGTLVVRGHATVEVTGTGPRSELGRIGASLASVTPERTRLEQEVARVVRRVAALGAVACVALTVIEATRTGNWIAGFLAGLALAMALLPEELPMVLTIFPAVTAWRLSKQGVLTRRMSALEAIGTTTVLCTDKTGTLTENRMRIATLVAGGAEHVARGEELPEVVHHTVEFGILASQRDPFDPMEAAFHRLGIDALSGTEHLHGDWELVREYPLTPALLSICHVWRAPAGDRYVVAAKGAPETVIDLCHLDADRAASIAKDVERLAARGERVIAVARAYFAVGPLPESQHDFAFEFVGLVGLEDPVRHDVPAAVDACRTAGIRVVMITGDYPSTALAVASRIGLHAPDVLTGAELSALSDDALTERLRTANVCARVVPEQKLRIVRALAAAGEIVTMTGDGVNDAPAVKAAAIGVAMGARGTDVAREAAALVLTRDSFAALVTAVRMGRRVYRNLEKAATYILAVHVPVAGLALLPPLLGWEPALLPLHIVFLELVIDPACSVAFEAEPASADIMERPPRAPTARLFSGALLRMSFAQGAGLLLGSFATLVLFRPEGAEVARAAAFVALVAGNVTLIWVNRAWDKSSWRLLREPNPAAGVVIASALTIATLAVFVPPVREVFRFGALGAGAYGTAVALGVASVLWFDLVKARLLRTVTAGGPAREARPGA